MTSILDICKITRFSMSIILNSTLLSTFVQNSVWRAMGSGSRHGRPQGWGSSVGTRTQIKKCYIWGGGLLLLYSPVGWRFCYFFSFMRDLLSMQAAFFGLPPPLRKFLLAPMICAATHKQNTVCYVMLIINTNKLNVANK